MYKILATDLDETLLNDQKEVSKENIEAINKAIDNGFKITLASGRGFYMFQDLLKQLNLKNKNNYSISYNGALITNNLNNDIIYEAPITFDEANLLFKTSLKYKVYIHVYTVDNIYVYDNGGGKRYLDKKIKTADIKEQNIDFLKGQNIYKICLENGDLEYLKWICEDMKDVLKDFETAYSGNSFTEFNKKGVSKGNSLCILCNLLNIDVKDSIAIGDSTNDISMLKSAGLGVGVKNLNKDILPYIKYVTKDDNNGAPISEVINKFMFN